MRRADRRLGLEEAEIILAEGIFGVLSMNGQDEYAYGVPMSYVFTGDSIYMHSAVEGRKLDRIRQDNRVSFSVVGEAIPLVETFCMKYMSTIVFGTVHEVENEEKLKALYLLAEKYSTDQFREKGRAYAVDSAHRTVVLRLAIELISGKSRK